MLVWVSLLRGVNLGARNKVSMPALRDALTAAGFSDVSTYLQSGNVIARSGHRSRAGVASAVADTVRDRLGLDLVVVVRTPRELADLVAWDPFPADSASRPTAVQVLHLTAQPPADRTADLLAQDWSPDGVVVRGTEAVVRYDEVMHNSRLQHAMVLRRLGVDGTARNWRTVTALARLAANP